MKNKQNIYFAANTLIILLMAAIVAGSVSAQKADRPNFAGVWVLDLKKSDARALKPYTGKLEKTERFASRLQIDHKEPTIRLTETFMAESLDNSKSVIGTRATGRMSTLYNTDGRGETNRLDGRRDWGSKTEWKGNTIFVNRPDLNAPINRTTLEFSLSKDGSELRIIERTFQKLPAVGFQETEITPSGGKRIYVRYLPAVMPDK